MKCIMFCKFIGGETTHHRCLVSMVIPVSDMDKQACFSLLPKSNDTAMTSELTQIRIFSDVTILGCVARHSQRLWILPGGRRWEGLASETMFLFLCIK